jgi:amino acid transporter
MLGLLQAHWTYTGFDASAHMAEETSQPRVRAPWGIVLSVAVAGITGYVLLIALTLAIRDIPSVLGARDAQGNSIPAAIAVLQTALGAKFGNAMAAFASMAMWFCGLSCITSASRAVFSLARDQGTPFAAIFRRVNPRHGTPGPAIWGIVAASLLAMLWTGAVPIVTSLSTVALYVAYIIPVILGLLSRNRGWTKDAVWTLGRHGPWINAVSVVYTITISIVLVMPPNDLAGKTFLGVLGLLALIYWIDVRKKFKGPQWSRAAHIAPVGKSNL